MEYKTNTILKKKKIVREPLSADWRTNIQHVLLPHIYLYLKCGRKKRKTTTSEFEKKVISTLNKRITTVVYCAAGGRSEMACKLLLKKGFKLLYDLQGGYEEYTN